MTKRFIHIWLVVLLLVVACGSDKHQLALLDSAETVMTTAPDTALALLDSIDSDRLSRADNARYALLRSQALDKNYIDVTNDSLINIAVEYYHNSQNYRYKGMAYFYMGRICYNKGEYDSAVECYVLAEEALLLTNEHNIIALTYAHMASVYEEQLRLEEAIETYRKAFPYLELCNNHLNTAYNHLQISRLLMINQPADSVLLEIDKAQAIGQEMENEELLFIVENYRASFYDYIKEYDKAKHILSNAFEQYPAHIPNADDYFLLSRIYFNSGQLDSALFCLDNYYAPLCQTFSDKETLAIFRSNIYKAKQDYAQAYNYLLEYHRSTNKSGLFKQNNSIKELEQKYRTQIFKQKSQSLKTRNILLSIVAILATIITLLFVYLYYRQRQLRITQYWQLHELAREGISDIQCKYDEIKAQLETQEARMQLSDNALKCRIDTLKILLEMSNMYETNTKLFYEKCRNYINICDLNEESFVRDIRDIASLYKYNFVQTLQDRFPLLSNEEINLCCFIMMGFDISHIRVLFNHSNIQSTYTKRGRLRRKLGLNSNDSIESFLLSL